MPPFKDTEELSSLNFKMILVIGSRSQVRLCNRDKCLKR